jgi:hypothetical protein
MAIWKRGICLTLLSLPVLLMSAPNFATCVGADPCHACKNCKYCGFCAKRGGTCGVCKK